MNIFDHYFPDIADIPASAVSIVRERLVAHAQPMWPTLDMRPNSVFGDAHVTPLAFLIAGLEIAMDRMRSDVTIENVANGIVYDCEFVSQFLQNFTGAPSDAPASIGILRLVFSENTAVSIPRNVQFTVNEGVYTVFAPHPGSVEITVVGAPTSIDTNSVGLVDGGGFYYADVAVTGYMATQVTAGTTAKLDRTIPNLVSATAVQDFVEGSPAQSVVELAKRSRAFVHAAGNNTPGGIVKLLNSLLPGIVGAAVVCSGDPEMLRPGTAPKADVMVKSSLDGVQAAINVLLNELETDIFAARIHTPGAVVTGLVSLKDSDGNVLPDSAWELYSRSSDGARADMASAAYSELEELYVVIKLPYLPTGAPAIPVQYVDGQRQVGITVTVTTDPMLVAARNVLGARTYKPIGTDTLVRGFTPIVFDRFSINYRRKVGAAFNQELARSEVLAYVVSALYPDGFSEALLNDKVFMAGAHDVTSVEAVGVVRWSVADFFIPAASPSPLEQTYEELVAARRKPPTVTFPSLKSVRYGYIDGYIGTAQQTNVCLGARNTAFVLQDSSLSFVEVFDT